MEPFTGKGKICTCNDRSIIHKKILTTEKVGFVQKDGMYDNCNIKRISIFFRSLKTILPTKKVKIHFKKRKKKRLRIW